MIKKTYLLDTNVLMYEPKSLFAFEDNEVVIPLVVLDELDKKKDGSDQAARHARMAIRFLDEMRSKGNIRDGIKTERGGIIRVELNHKDHAPSDLDPNRVDNRIISVAIGLGKDGKNVKVISKDINLRVKCDALGVVAEDYTSDSVVDSLDHMFAGHSELIVASSKIDELYSCGFVDLEMGRVPFVNEYVHVYSETNTKHSALARFNGKNFEKIKSYSNIWGISPRNKHQAFVLDALFNPDIKLVTITGKAGCGKTLLSAAAGVQQLLESKIYKRIVMTRPVQPLGRDLGFLPGDIAEKMKPWMAPLHDNLELIFSDKGKYFIDSLKDEGKIDIEPITYIRGRSIPMSYIIIDECQNLSKHEVKTIITRSGEGSKIILAGDVEQVDTPYLDSTENGLSCVIEKFKNEKIAAHITLIKGERSELATLASEML